MVKHISEGESLLGSFTAFEKVCWLESAPRNAVVLGMVLICLGNLCQASKEARSSCSFHRLNAHWKDLVLLGLWLMKIGLAGDGTFEFGNSYTKCART